MKQQVAVITGAASGIGLALVQACIHRHMHVVMIDRAVDVLSEAHQRLKSTTDFELLAVPCDVTDADAFKESALDIFQHFPQVHLLINNAGINGPMLPLWEVPLEAIKKVHDINFFGVLHGIQAFLPLMFEQGAPSHVVNMASVYGLCSGSLVGSYATSKHAILALSESLYFDLKRLKKPVDVSVVCPSFVNTPLLKHAETAQNVDFYEKLQYLFEHGRSPEEVAAHILREIGHKQFYILPDKEVKDYAMQRADGILSQQMPFEHSLEKIMVKLSAPKRHPERSEGSP